MAPDRHIGSRRNPAGDGQGLWPAELPDAEWDAIEGAFVEDVSLRTDAEALLGVLRCDLRYAFARAFAGALIGPPRPSVPAGALMPALGATIVVALTDRRGAQR